MKAAITVLAVVVSFLLEYAVCAQFAAGSGPALLAAFLALGLARRRATPPIWLRPLGDWGARIGQALLVPLLAMLVVPVAPHAPGGWPVDLALVIVAGVIAYVVTSIVTALSTQGRIPRPPRTSSASREIGLRVAAQVAVALATGFGVGLLFFPRHWGWAVLTAFIVSGATRGREDAAYRAFTRLAGAIAGTIVAAALQQILPPDDAFTWIALLVALFLGTWLRDVNYAFWAASFTLVLAMLQRFGEGFNLALLGERIEAIVAGAICDVLAAWLVFPIPTGAIARRLVADALSALADLLAGEGSARTFEHRIEALEHVRPALNLHRRFPAVNGDDHPAEWIAILRTIELDAQALSEERRAAIERAVKQSRRALGGGSEPVTDALRRLKASVEGAM